MLIFGGILSLASILYMATPTVAPMAHSTFTLEYSRPAGLPLYMDASIPDGPGPFPAAIIIHGGGWVRGDRRADVAPLFEPLERARIAWFSIDYRLLRDLTGFGAPIEDVRTAILYVKHHASEFHIDPKRIALIGESAGGQLAAMAALNPKTGTEVRAVVALYAPTDLVVLAKNTAVIPEQIRASLTGTPFETLLLAGLRQLSPLSNIRPGAPPFLLIHGTKDPLVPFTQSRAMCDALKANGAACELFPVEGAGHGIRWWESSSVETQPYKAAMVRWLQQEFGPVQN